MNWYIKQIFAQFDSLQGYLKSLGLAPDIMQYILSLDQKQAQILTNEVRKNPSLTLQQLQEVQMPQQKADPYLPLEKGMAANFELELPQFSKWILVSFRKIRRGISWKDYSGRDILPDGKGSPLTDQETMMYKNFKEKIREIADWYIAMNPDISSFSPQEATVASDEWHQMMAGQGEGKNYEPSKPENIVYGPQWKNPEWQGWTIQKVISENDLLAEGNKMNHCVGSFCDNVEEGRSIIYSLRDPQNNPKITLEFNGDSSYTPGSMEQIQGNSNQDPDEEYKPMIREWISTSGKENGIVTEINAFEDLEEKHSYESPRIEEINELLENVLQGEENEYGLKYIFDSDVETVINKLVVDAEAENSREQYDGNYYYGDITESPPYIVYIALKEDLKLESWPRHSQEYKDMIINNPKQTDWKNIQDTEKWAWETIDEIQEDFIGYDTGLEYPQEENYETTEEHEEALREFEDAEEETYDEWVRKSVKGGFAKDLLDEIKSFRYQGIIPSSQELQDKKKQKEE